MYHYEKSKLIECNRTSALINSQKNKTYQQDPKVILNSLDGMVYVSKVLEGFLKTYWLTDGSLLGMPSRSNN
jgi:hypothetical protein